MIENLTNNFLLPNNQKDDKNLRSNILLRSLKDFYKRCEASYGKLFYEKNYLISLNEIITLIQNSINAQQQLDKYIYNTNNKNSDSNYKNIKKINEKFINDLNYNIVSLEKKNNNYFSFNKTKKKTMKKRKLNNSKLLITPHIFKNRINSIFNNIAKEIFINSDEIKNSNYCSKEVSTYNTSAKSARE